MVLPGRPGGRVARRWDLSLRRCRGLGVDRPADFPSDARPTPTALKGSSQATDPHSREAPALDLRRTISTTALVWIVLATAACAHRDWRRALAEDTASGYSQFLREHPGSGYAPDARAHLALVRLRSRPTRGGFEAFSKEFGDSGLVDGARPYVEAAFFDQARALGSPEAYESFLADFGGGTFAARARGNAEYLRNRGFDGDPAPLSKFAADYPDSDFAAEAKRSVASLGGRAAHALGRTGLIVDVDPATPGADRLRRVFAERAVAFYRGAGLELVSMGSGSSAGSRAVGAVLRIAHREGPAQARLEQSTVSQSSLLAETEVTLRRSGDENPVWQGTFTHRAPLSAKPGDESILFDAAATTTYWARFFVPIASWQTREAVRDAHEFTTPPVAVDAAEGRAVVLFPDGSFELLDIADPAQPALLGEYRRARDLARFEGIALIGPRVAVFGQDGLELVSLAGGAPTRERAWPRDQIGSPTSVVDTGTGLALAGKRGLLWITDAAPTPRILVAREILGLARAGEHLLFTDGSTLYIATPSQLAAGRVASELKVGDAFAPRRVRVNGSRAVIVGERGVVSVDISDPNHPAVRSRLDVNEVGDVRDAQSVSGHLFLLGDRGLQVADRSGERVSDFVDVTASRQLVVEGRHLVLIGDRELQVVDATPFVAAVPAKYGGQR